MPRNENLWVSELLSWHGHDRGGVRVPFHATMGKPLGDVVETSLIRKIKYLARDLVSGTPETPRWIFLIGGPGNGKSEAVEAFVSELDTLANLNGELTNVVAKKFRPDPVAPRRVEVTADELQDPSLHEKLRSLIIVQDASAVDGPDKAAEDPLIEDLADLVTFPTGQEPVFICCANRGLVARARAAIQTKKSLSWLNDPRVTELLTQLLIATGLGPGALATDRPQCWPLDLDRRFAAWPLDLDSIIKTENETSPFEQMIVTATNERKWEGKNCCGDCVSRKYCPFYANAEILRDEDARRVLLQLLRHSEMATGQRWNFRDAFSLCAELMVGQRDDFSTGEGESSPCSWVHERVDEISFGTHPSRSLFAAWELVFQLYSQSLFPEWLEPIEELHERTLRRSEVTQSAVQAISQRQRSEGAQIRHTLSGVFSQKLDPALATPSDPDSILRRIEDEFGQSIKQGSETFEPRLIPIIERMLELMALAEVDWSEIVRESSRARAILESLRVLCTILVKRFLGVLEGEYLNFEHLFEYEEMHRNTQELWKIVQPLRAVLAPEDTFGGSLIRVFGQPSPDATRDILVTHRLGNVIPQVASESTDGRPGHDIPWVEVEGHRIPLTFDLYAALQAYASGAQIASFAPHTRAAIDKVRYAIAGGLARDRVSMLGGKVSVKVGNLGRLVPAADGTVEFEGGD